METIGRARVDIRTKELIPRARAGDIAIIDHEDIDEVSAQGLIDAKVAAVINAAYSVSGRYPNRGPLMIVDAGIPLVDAVGRDVMLRITEGDIVKIRREDVFVDGQWLGRGMLRHREELLVCKDKAQDNLRTELDRFIENTLDHAYRERGLFGDIRIPPVTVNFQNRAVLIVVRGQNYKEDLLALRAYIRENDPILVGVDGGADALIESGYRPDLIIGDMDSVTDATLHSGAELLVHAYPDGRAPGMDRLHRLGIKAKVIRSPGTSEDVALWVAHEQGADLIVAVGTHSNIIDFMEKGRKGMASTFLVRLIVGPILFDAKGVSKLYRRRPQRGHVSRLTVAAAIPFILVGSLSEPVKQWVSLIWLQLRVLTGW